MPIRILTSLGTSMVCLQLAFGATPDSPNRTTPPAAASETPAGLPEPSDADSPIPSADEIDRLRLRAEGGDAKAQAVLGWLYAKGRGVAADGKAAAEWLHKAMAQGDPRAKAYLAYLYGTGTGVSKDLRRADTLLQEAAEAGDVLGQYNLGLQQLARRRYDVALRWIGASALQGHPPALAKMGSLHAKGDAVPKDAVRAYAFLNLAAALGHREAAAARDELERQLLPQQLAAAQAMSSDLNRLRQALRARPAGNVSPDLASGLEPKGNGTGFLITDEGHVVTCLHVVRNAVRLEVHVGGKRLPASLIGQDTEHDIAILEVPGRFRALPVVPSQPVRQGDDVWTLGFPRLEIQGSEPKLTDGVISSLTGITNSPRHFQISVPVQPGNSGGPLVDQTGNVIGMVVATLNLSPFAPRGAPDPQNVNYALKSSFILASLEAQASLRGKLKKAATKKKRPRREIVQEIRESTVLIVAY